MLVRKLTATTTASSAGPDIVHSRMERIVANAGIKTKYAVADRRPCWMTDHHRRGIRSECPRAVRLTLKAKRSVVRILAVARHENIANRQSTPGTANRLAPPPHECVLPTQSAIPGETLGNLTTRNRALPGNQHLLIILAHRDIVPVPRAAIDDIVNTQAGITVRVLERPMRPANNIPGSEALSARRPAGPLVAGAAGAVALEISDAPTLTVLNDPRRLTAQVPIGAIRRPAIRTLAATANQLQLASAHQAPPVGIHLRRQAAVAIDVQHLRRRADRRHAGHAVGRTGLRRPAVRAADAKHGMLAGTITGHTNAVGVPLGNLATVAVDVLDLRRRAERAVAHLQGRRIAARTGGIRDLPGRAARSGRMQVAGLAAEAVDQPRRVAAVAVDVAALAGTAWTRHTHVVHLVAERAAVAVAIRNLGRPGAGAPAMHLVGCRAAVAAVVRLLAQRARLAEIGRRGVVVRRRTARPVLVLDIARRGAVLAFAIHLESPGGSNRRCRPRSRRADTAGRRCCPSGPEHSNRRWRRRRRPRSGTGKHCRPAAGSDSRRCTHGPPSGSCRPGTGTNRTSC